MKRRHKIILGIPFPRQCLRQDARARWYVIPVSMLDEFEVWVSHFEGLGPDDFDDYRLRPGQHLGDFTFMDWQAKDRAEPEFRMAVGASPEAMARMVLEWHYREPKLRTEFTLTAKNISWAKRLVNSMKRKGAKENGTTV